MNRDIILPHIRQDLKIMPAQCAEDGSPQWHVYDRICHRYFSVSEDALILIKFWQPNLSVTEFCQLLKEKVGVEYDAGEIIAFVSFLNTHDLLARRSPSDVSLLDKKQQDKEISWWQWLLHNYLFIRVPLIHPHSLLSTWVPRINFVFNPVLHYFVLVLGCIGGLLVIRQWEEFSNTFSYFFNIKGIIFYAITLIVVKSAHELGHAVVSHRLGCRVSSMGVAFLVMFPVLYTDTTDAWKLPSRKDRLRITTAGIRVELYIALLATFFWNIIPDGILKSCMFFVATTSWITSLAVNISPYMRFDGYYAFSDLINVNNLAHRAFSFGRWQIRKTLLGIDAPVPEPLPKYKARLLIGYSFFTWIYRFFLFFGIAVLVYHTFFKLLGIVLFAIEISWFILMPIFRELQNWQKLRDSIMLTPFRIVFLVSCGCGLLYISLPTSVSVHMPAVINIGQNQTIYPAEPAQISRILVNDGQFIKKGETIFSLKSTELDKEIALLNIEKQQIQLSLSRQISSVTEKAQGSIMRQHLERINRQIEGILQRQDKLLIIAPFSGYIQMSNEFNVNQWVSNTEPLLTLVGQSDVVVDGYANESDIDRLKNGQSAVFIANQGTYPKQHLVLKNLGISAEAALTFPELTSEYGGDLAVNRVKNQYLIPQEAYYHVRFQSSDELLNLPSQRLAGEVIVNTDSQSWLLSKMKQVIAAVIRESGW